MRTQVTIRRPEAASVRASALAGALFFTLVVVNSNLQTGTPSISDSRQETFAFLAAHQDRLQLSAVLWGFAMCAALWWVAGLARALRNAGERNESLAVTATAGGVLAAASILTAALIEGTIATRLADLGAAGARVFWALYLLSLCATLFGLVVLIAATAVACIRTDVFARWFAIASLILVLVSIAGAFAIGYASTALQAVAGVALLLDSGWIFAVSIFLFRDPTLVLRDG
jgi:hypothetical protein